MVYPRSDGELITILSIDGGGVHGIVPAVVLKFLEEQLKILEKDENVRIADYFDVISGTGSGSLVAAMLTKPSEEHPLRPKYDMPKIITSLQEINSKAYAGKAETHDGEKKDAKTNEEKTIWERAKDLGEAAIHLEKKLRELASSFVQDPVKSGKDVLESIKKLLFHSDYQVEKFADKLKEYLGNTRLDEAMSDVVVPVFNFKNTRPLVFSTNQAKKHHEYLYDDVTLKDVVLASSAIPTIFPIHSFKYLGKRHTFADGSLVSNNPTLLGLQEGARIYDKELNYQNNYLVLSLGTGRPRSVSMDILNMLEWIKHHPTVTEALKGIKGRLLQYVYILGTDIMETYMTHILPPHNYLRIQDFEPTDSLPSAIDGSESGFDRLKKFAEEALGRPTILVDPNTGVHTKQETSNKYELTKFAERLCVERKRRLNKQACQEINIIE